MFSCLLKRPPMTLLGFIAAFTMLATTAVIAPRVGAAPTVATFEPGPDQIARYCDLTGGAGSYRSIPLNFAVGGRVGSLAAGTGSTITLDEPLPPGTYEATYLSYDGYLGREWVYQPAEVWDVVFLAERTEAGILGAIGPTADLADGVAEAHQAQWPPDAVTSITTTADTNFLAIRNAAPLGASSANSVRPVCLNLYRIDAPDPDPDPQPDPACSTAEVAYTNPLATFGQTTGKLWIRSTTHDLAAPAGGIPAGTYDLVGASYDGYDGRSSETWETDEVWVAEFQSADGRVLAASQPSVDLPDGAGSEEASWAGAMGRITLTEPAARIVARHAASDDRAPNSVHPACIGLTPWAGPGGLPDARPADEVNWDEVRRDWLLAIAHGDDVVDGLQAQGLYLVDPLGDRWLLHSSIRDPRVEGLSAVLDFSLATREALVLVSGPRDMNHVGLVNLEDGTISQFTSRIGGEFVPKAQVRWNNVDDPLLHDFLLSEYDGGGTRLVRVNRAGTESTQFGPTYPAGQRVDWINGPGPLEFVYTNDVADGRARGTVTLVTALDEEQTVSRNDCVPVRWVPAGLVAVCDSVGLSTTVDLYVIPFDGSRLWPAVDYDIVASLGVDGFRDLHIDTRRAAEPTSLILESGTGQVWRLNKGCGDPILVEPPADVQPGLDVVGLVDGWVVAVDGQRRLVRFPLNGGAAVVLLDRVVDAERWDEYLPIGSQTFPEPPVYGTNTCAKRGNGAFNLLTDIRWADHDGYTRVVFDFQDEHPSVPSWAVGYVDGPVYPDVVVRPEITGDGLLNVWLNPSSTLDLSDPDNTFRTYNGPLDIDVGIGTVEAIVIVEDFEAHLQWIIDVDGHRSFTAFTLSDPPRLVIDILDQ